MSSVTENGDVTAGKPNEEKTYKKVNKTYDLFIACFSLLIGNPNLLWVKQISELAKHKNKENMFHWFFWKYFICSVKS